MATKNFPSRTAPDAPPSTGVADDEDEIGTIRRTSRVFFNDFREMAFSVLSATPLPAAMGVAPPLPPPFPIDVERFIAELAEPSTAAHACAAFATLATKAQVPGSFRGAIPAVLGLVAREQTVSSFPETKESALAVLVALLACVPGAAEDAIKGKVIDVVLAAAQKAEGGLDLNTMESFRILATVDAAACALVEDGDAMDNLIRFVTDRCVGSSVVLGNNGNDQEIVAESALDLLCGLAAKRSDGGLCRDAVVTRNGVAALGRALVFARNDEIAVRAILGLVMTTANEQQRNELVAVPGAVAALTRATRSPDGDVKGGAKILLKALGGDEALRPAIAAALRETMASGAAADLDLA